MHGLFVEIDGPCTCTFSCFKMSTMDRHRHHRKSVVQDENPAKEQTEEEEDVHRRHFDKTQHSRQWWWWVGGRVCVRRWWWWVVDMSAQCMQRIRVPSQLGETPGDPGTPSPPQWRGSTLALCLCTGPHQHLEQRWWWWWWWCGRET